MNGVIIDSRIYRREKVGKCATPFAPVVVESLFKVTIKGMVSSNFVNSAASSGANQTREDMDSKPIERNAPREGEPTSCWLPTGFGTSPSSFRRNLGSRCTSLTAFPDSPVIGASRGTSGRHTESSWEYRMHER